jgi:hypothetical protein
VIVPRDIVVQRLAGDKVMAKPVNKKSIPIRATERQWAIIDERATKAGMSRSAYMLACARATHEPMQLSGKERRDMYEKINDIWFELNKFTASVPEYPKRMSDRGGQVMQSLGMRDQDRFELRDAIITTYHMAEESYRRGNKSDDTEDPDGS